MPISNTITYFISSILKFLHGGKREAFSPKRVTSLLLTFITKCMHAQMMPNAVHNLSVSVALI